MLNLEEMIAIHIGKRIRKVDPGENQQMIQIPDP